MSSNTQSCENPALAADLDGQIEALLEFPALWHLDSGTWGKNTAIVNSIPVHQAIHIQN
jgi:hypothetical protein